MELVRVVATDKFICILFIFYDIVKCTITNVNVKILQLIK